MLALRLAKSSHSKCAEIAAVLRRPLHSLSSGVNSICASASPGPELPCLARVAEGQGLWEAQVCGRGDKRTRRGKRFKGSHGNCRHQKGWETRRLREKWEIPSGPAPGSLLPRPFPPLLSRF